MGYIKAKHRQLLDYIDMYGELPNKWDKLIKENEQYHNLIIKEKGICTCTNCNHKFVSSKKVNKTEKCPNCKHIFLIKSGKLTNYKFSDYFALLDKVDDTLVIRYFETLSTYNKVNDEYKINRSTVEFCRSFIGEDYATFLSNRVTNCNWNRYINHYEKQESWREYSRSYSAVHKAIVYPYNIKKVLKNTPYKYSMLWDLAKHSEYINIESLLEDSLEYPSIEMLIKFKLYNLALRGREFENNGSFQKIFGVSKDFYPFMKKYNITYTQLEILQLLKKKDIKAIRYLEKFSTYDLQEISNYISIDKFISYAKLHHGKIDTSLYKDYLRLAIQSGYDIKNKKYAFPKDLKAEHDKLVEQFRLEHRKKVNMDICKRGEMLSKNIFKNKEFIIFPAMTLASLEDESKQQHNCVRTYAEKYGEGICDIYFVRNIKKQNKSLVTVEVKDNKVVQSKIKYNKNPNKIQISFLNEWEQKVLKEVA